MASELSLHKELSRLAGELISPYPALNSITNNVVSLALFVYFSLPGFGAKTKEICNTVTSADYCPSCHRTVGRYYHCKNFYCPECFRSAARQAASRAADYLIGCHRAWHVFGKSQGYVNHLELSVPKNQYLDYDKKKMNDKAIKYAKQIGISGGGLVFHPFRIKKELQRPIQQAVRAAGKKMGSWDAMRENILGLPSREDYLVFSPHFHIVGYFKLKQKSNQFYNETGWTYTNISRKHGRGSEDQDGVFRIFSYILTHHYHAAGKQAIHYFGTASKNKVSRETWKEKQDKKCTCGEQMYRIAIWSEERVQQIRDGTHRIESDDFISKSKIIIVHNRYWVNSTQTKIETFYNQDDQGGGSQCPPPIPDVNP